MSFTSTITQAMGPLAAAEDNGWCPFAEPVPSPNYLVGHRGRRAVVIHIAQGTYSGSINWLTNPASKASAHFIVARDGRLCQMVSTNNTAWANGLRWRENRWWNVRGKRVSPTWSGLQPPWDPNWSTISIEHEGRSGEPFPEAMVESSVRLLQWIAERYHLVYVAGSTLIGHSALDTVDRTFCPGPGVDLAGLAAAASAGMRMPAVPGMLSAASPICGSPTGDQQAVVAAVRKDLPDGSEYAGDVETIIGLYWRYGTAVGVDPFLASVQCVLETGGLTSFWSGRPRRNPINIGVTGKISTQRPKDPAHWWWDSARKRWLEGVAFPTWEEAVQAHLGHLLLYAHTDAKMTPAQLAMSKHSPRREILNASFPTYRGSASRWQDLDGRWRGPGDAYSARLIALANQIRGNSTT